MANAVVSLVMSTRNGSGKKESMSVTNVNPQATNAQIIEFSNKLLALSNNSLVTISKVTKEEVYNNG